MPAKNAFTAHQIDRHLAELGGGWKAVGVHHLSKAWNFPNFVDGLAFVNKVGAIAEKAGHHPDIALRWGQVRVDLWTHSLDGLGEGDFALAAQIDAA